MRTFGRLAALALVACLATATGCIKMKQMITVNPDGSGKIERVIGLGPTVLGMAAMGPGGDPFEQFHPGAMAAEVEGIVAAKRGERFEKDGWKYMTVVAYFDDINKVKPPKAEGEAEAEAQAEEEGGPGLPQIVFRKLDDGTFELAYTDTEAKERLEGEERNAEDEAQKQMMKGMMAGMLNGFEMTIAFRMPGEVTSTPEGLKKDGRTASITVDAPQLMAVMEDPSKAPPTTGTIRAAAAADEVKAEVEAYRKERQEAIDGWAALKKEWEEIKQRQAKEMPMGPEGFGGG